MPFGRRPPAVSPSLCLRVRCRTSRRRRAVKPVGSAKVALRGAEQGCEACRRRTSPRIQPDPVLRSTARPWPSSQTVLHPLRKMRLEGTGGGINGSLRRQLLMNADLAPSAFTFAAACSRSSRAPTATRSERRVTAPTAVRPPVPEPGQVVEVRGSTWAVANVQAQGLPRSPADEATAGLTHVVDLQSLDEGRLGEQLSVVWELEVGHTVTPAQGLPGRIDPQDFDQPDGAGRVR